MKRKDGKYSPLGYARTLSQVGKNTKKSAIVFDFDGTIADSFPSMIGYLQGFRKYNDNAVIDFSSLRNMSEIHLVLSLAIPLWRLPFLVYQIRRWEHKHLNTLPLVPGIKPVLEKLSETHKLYIVSGNSTENVRDKLLIEHLDPIIVSIEGSTSVIRKPAALHKLLKHEALAPGSTWYVGDEAGDVKTAKKAGMHTIAVTWGYCNLRMLKASNPDAIVFTPEELLKCFQPKVYG